MSRMRPTCDRPRYQIIVRGELGDGLAEIFGGLSVTSSRGVTRIHGQFVDQSELYGLLARIRDLGLGLVSVNRIDHPEAHGDP